MIQPYGGKLIDLFSGRDEQDELSRRAQLAPSIQLSPRSICDLQLMAVGAFSPLDRFMGIADYRSVLSAMRMTNGALFPIPITLNVELGRDVRIGRDVVLRNLKGTPMALMTIEEIFEWDPTVEAQSVYGTTDDRYPIVAEMYFWNRTCISGPIKALRLPGPAGYADLHHSPAEIRSRPALPGEQSIIAFQISKESQWSEESICKLISRLKGRGLLQLVSGQPEIGDVSYYNFIHRYKDFATRPSNDPQIVVSLLPWLKRTSGVRETILRAIIGRNYGATHLAIEDADPSSYSTVVEQRSLQNALSKEVGVELVLCDLRAHSSSENRKVQPSGDSRRQESGGCVWFTGFSGSGKSTIAEILAEMLAAQGRQTTILDGDIVRAHLSKGLGYSREDRNRNVLKIGYVAAEIVRHHGIAICAVISPYSVARNFVRNMIGKDQFVLVFMDTPLPVCESRDPKGFYAKARRGEITGFTGIDDLYEPPRDPDITLSDRETAAENAKIIFDYLVRRGIVY
jgi:sulfate adenylyltransferase